MVFGIGVDIIEISRIEKVVSRKDAFLDKVFTPKERKYFESRNMRAEVIAGNFAAKEAVAKALGVGFGSVGWTDIEILRDPLGKPYVILYNNAKNIVGDKFGIHISISHSRDNAVANAVIEIWEEASKHEYSYMCADERS